MLINLSKLSVQVLHFGAKAKPADKSGLKAVQPKSDDGVKWYYGRPQTSDWIEHSEGHKTKVTSLIDGGQIFNRINALLDRAKDNVMVDIYELQDPTLNPDRITPPDTPGAEAQKQIVTKLINLAKSGVKVRVVIDNSYEERFKRHHNDKVIEHLKANGVEVLAYPKDKAKISHVKMLVVDNQFAVIGGMNWGGHSPMNHDACVMLEGKEVGNLAAHIFKVDYEFSGGDVSSLPPIETVPEEKIKILTTSPVDAPDGGGSEIYDEITKRIDNAKHSIVCELFSLTDKTIADKLLAAHERLKADGKPGVRIMVDPGLYLAFANCRPTIDRLEAAGVPIRFFKPDWANEQKLHGKWAVFDEEELFIGSANWSKAGLRATPSAPATPPAETKPASAKKKNAAKVSPDAKLVNSPTGKKSFLPNHEANLAISSREVSRAFLKQFEFDWKNRSLFAKVQTVIDDIPEALRSEFVGKDLLPQPAAGTAPQASPAVETPAAPTEAAPVAKKKPAKKAATKPKKKVSKQVKSAPGLKKVKKPRKTA